ncbi:MAG: alkaline phosphatase [Treponema sp.]|jgi:predicted AlkP superfamily pyrophosphatase or phosphodiesterase|nr:alkaline phosphatase [Treponema sp.]
MAYPKQHSPLGIPGTAVFYILLAASLFAAASLAACAGDPRENLRLVSAPEERDLREFRRGGPAAQHLVFIGLDGWGAAYVPRAKMPTVKRMIAQGSSAMNARAVLPTVSWPNWSSLFSGAPPELRTAKDFPSIFTLLKKQKPGGGAALFYEWGPLEDLCGGEEADKGRILSNEESARKVAAYIREKKPSLTAVVFNEPDGTGHSKRWGSRAYYGVLAELDGFIAAIEEAVREAGIYDSTVFMVSSDHGGTFWGHGYNIRKQREIPLVVYGGGIREGYVLSSPVSICDLAPTMALILGLEIPREWTGRPLTEIFK